MPAKKTPRADLKAQEPSAALALTDGEAGLIQFFDEMDEFLETPFCQPSALAESGVPFTILKAATRIGTKMETEEEVEQFVYKCELENDLSYVTRAKEKREFKAGDAIIVALQTNAIRTRIHDEILHHLQTQERIPHMALKFVAPSRKSAAKGFAPPIRLCHVSQWEAYEG